MGLIDKLETRASTGGQWFLKNPDAFALQLFGGSGSASGLTIGADTAVEWTALAAALRILSQTMASLPLHVYRRLDRGKERVQAHPLQSLLHSSPNPEQTAAEFRALIPIHAILWGFFVAEVVRQNGAVAALWPLNPDRVRVTRNDRGDTQFEVYVDGARRILRRDQVLYVPGFITNGLVGRSLVADHQEAIGLGLATELYTAKFFGNDATPGGFLRHPETLSEEAQKRLKSSWESAHRGLDRAHRVAVLEEGMEWVQTTVDPEKAQALGLRKFTVNEAVRIVTGVPPHLIGDLERSTFSNIEQQSLEFVQYGLQPWLVKIEQRVWLSLFTENEKASGLFAEHVVEGILRGDSQSRAAFYMQMFNLGALSPNDIREKENANPIEGGDEYFIRLDMQPLTRATEPPPEPEPFPPAPPEPEEDEPEDEDEEEDEDEGRALRPPETRALMRQTIQRSFDRLFTEAMARLTAREIARVRRELKRLEAGDFAGFSEFLRSYYFEKLPPDIKALVGPLFRSYAEAMARAAAEEIGADLDEQRARDFTDSYIDTFANRHARSSRTQLEQLLSEPADSLDAISGRLDEWEAGTATGRPRHERVADRELHQLGNGVARAVFIAGGVTTLVWRTLGDSCPICESLEGAVVGVEASFVAQGQVYKEGNMEAPLVPRSNISHPPIHSGCDCVVVPGG